MSVSIPDDMLELARQAFTQAYCPYSNFPVGACIKAADGTLHTGCNVENASYGLSLCAEANAIAHMVANGQREIQSIVIATPTNSITSPCGACRQRIAEFATADTQIYLCSTHSQQQFTMHELLPHAFSPKNLEKP
mgnify:CR=1 FL=1|jgi:cytidine deaminase